MDASIVSRIINSRENQLLIEEYSNDNKNLTLSLPDSNFKTISTLLTYLLTFSIKDEDGKKQNKKLTITIK